MDRVEIERICRGFNMFGALGVRRIGALLVVAVSVAACGEPKVQRATSEPVPVPRDPSPPSSAAPRPRAASTGSASPSGSMRFVGAPEPSEMDLVDAPWVKLTADHKILVDDGEIATTEGYDESMTRIEPLLAALKEHRDKYMELRPGKGFPGVLVVEADDSVKAAVVKSVVQTAAFAGYPNVSFAVHKQKP